MKIRIDSEGRDVTDLYGLHDESDTILEVGMFENWKVGQTGWVRLRNGDVALAVHMGDDSKRPVNLTHFKGDSLGIDTCSIKGRVYISEESNCDVIAHLPDCTGFDWEPETIQWSEGVYPMQESSGCELYDVSANPREPKLGVFHQETPHVWKVGDWFVVDEASDEDWFVSPMHKLVGVPQCVDEVDEEIVRANGWYWFKKHCRPCDPPKPEPAPTRFKPSVEYVGIHDAI